MSSPVPDLSPLEQAIEEFLRAEEALQQFSTSVSELQSARDTVTGAEVELSTASRAVRDATGALRHTGEILRATCEQLRENAISIGKFRPDALEESVRTLASGAGELVARVSATESVLTSTESTLTQHSSTLSGLAGQVAGLIERTSDLRVALDALSQATRDQRGGIDQLRTSVDRESSRARWVMVAALLASVLSATTLAVVLVSGA